MTEDIRLELDEILACRQSRLEIAEQKAIERMPTLRLRSGCSLSLGVEP